MMKHLYTLSIALIFTFAFYSLHAFQSKPDVSYEKAIDSILINYKGNDRPGMTIGIVKEGKLVFQKGYGMADLKKHKANSSQVIYNIASGSKQFTACAIASLIQQQKISLQDTIGKFFPEFPDYGKSITIEDLLYHTSGIRDYMVLMWLTGKSFEEQFDNRNAMDLIMRQTKLNFKPGERCVYSNSNYVMLAGIIDRVTGKTVTDFSTDLFKEFNMNSSSFGKQLKKEHAVTAVSYFKSGNQYQPYQNNFNVHGDGGVRTTLLDLVQWDHAFYDSTSIVQNILKKGALKNGNTLNYGMGIQFGSYRNEIVQTHPGAFLGYRTEILRFPSRKTTIICLGNSEDINPEFITHAIADVCLFGIKKTAVSPQPSADKSIQKPVGFQEAESYTGIYQVVPNVLIHIRYEDGLLTGQVTGQPRQILCADSIASFNIGATGDQVVFDELLRGKYHQLTVMQKQGNTIAQRLPLVSQEDYSRYTGLYYSEEQNATYQFYLRDGNLYFKVGSNAEVKAEILASVHRVYFDFKNLEQATIDFSIDNTGSVKEFVLSSGRINGIRFVKK